MMNDEATNPTNLKSIEVSVIIPVLNEEENVKILYTNISQVLQNCVERYEIIFIDDGSNDKTFEILKEIHKNDPNLKIIKFRENFGQSAATAAGFDYATGDIIITMDGDLQNDPNDIPNILAKLEEGSDVVSGWRENRQDKLLVRKIPSQIANSIIRKVTDVQLHDTGCALKAYRSIITKRLNLYGEMHRFLPALARIEGAKISELKVNHRARIYGKSKYNLSRTYKVIMDLMSLNLFVKYLRHPLHFFGIFAGLFTFCATLLIGIILFSELLQGMQPNEFNNLMTIDFLLFATGFQLFFIGLVGEMINKTAHKRDYYLLNDLIGKSVKC